MTSIDTDRIAGSRAGGWAAPWIGRRAAIPPVATSLERAAARTPWLIVGYFAAHFMLRLALSCNLETDEAELVGKTFLALGYGNGHPPLYNWMVAAMLGLTGHWPAAVASVKAMLLAGSCFLAFDIMRRITGRALPGLMVVCAFLLLPQVVFKSQITLTHSVLVMGAVIAVMHGVVLIVQRGDLLRFAWLGLAIAAGGMAKYNFFLALAAILVAAASVAPIRQKLFQAKFVFSLGIFAVLFAPHVVWALRNWRQTTSRLYKMERAGDGVLPFDLPFIGLDGLLDIVTSTLAWAGPLLAVWFAIRAFTRPHPDRGLDRETAIWPSFFGRTALLGIGAFTAIIVLGDKHAVYERYLTPLLIPLPFWLALAWPLDRQPRAALHLARICAAMAALMLTAWPLWTMLGREQFAYPYRAMAASLSEAAGPGPLAVTSSQAKYATNLVLHLPGATLWAQGQPPARVAVTWHERRNTPPSTLLEKLGKLYVAKSPIFAWEHPYENFSGHRARLRAQIYIRLPEGDAAGADTPDSGPERGGLR